MKDRCYKILSNCYIGAEDDRKKESKKALRSISYEDIKNVADFCSDTRRTHYMDLIYYGLIAGYVIGYKAKANEDVRMVAF